MIDAEPDFDLVSHEEPTGVRWKRTLGLSASQVVTSVVLCGQVIQHHVDVPARVRFDRFRESA